MLYLLQDQSTLEYALYNELTNQYSWWCPSVDRCWKLYNKGDKSSLATGVKDIINSRSHYNDCEVKILQIYTLDSHPEYFI